MWIIIELYFRWSTISNDLKYIFYIPDFSHENVFEIVICIAWQEMTYRWLIDDYRWL